jgi:hypothetical protein
MKGTLMSSIAMIPNNTSVETITISSKSYSMLLLSLSAYGVTLRDDCDCGECEVRGAIEILPEEVAKVCEALSDICSRAIDAGLRDLSLEFAFLLSVLPSSGGMHAEKIDN